MILTSVLMQLGKLTRDRVSITRLAGAWPLLHSDRNLLQIVGALAALKIEPSSPARAASCSVSAARLEAHEIAVTSQVGL